MTQSDTDPPSTGQNLEWVKRLRKQYSVPDWVWIAFSVFLIETVGWWLLAATVGLGVRPTGTVVAVGAVLFGPVAAPGIFLGTLLARLLMSGTVIALVNAFAVTLGVVLAWNAVEEFGPKRIIELRGWTSKYVFIVICTLCITAATIGVLSDALGIAPFQLTTGRFLKTNLPLALAVAPVAWYAARRPPSDDLGGADSRKSQETRDGVLLSIHQRAVLFGLTSVSWVLAGYVVGFVFRATEQVPADRIGNRLVPAVARFLERVGPRGVVVQLVLGLIALALLLVSVDWLSFDRGRR